VLDEKTFKVFFAGVLLLFGAYMVLDWIRNPAVRRRGRRPPVDVASIGRDAGATTGSGFLSGSMGIGGGLLNVPSSSYVLGRKTRKAIGTSSLLIIPTAAVGFVAYLAGLAFRPTASPSPMPTS